MSTLGPWLYQGLLLDKTRLKAKNPDYDKIKAIPEGTSCFFNHSNKISHCLKYKNI